MSPSFDNLPEILTPVDIKEYLRYGSINTVYNLLRAGQIRAIGGNKVKSNRLWRVTKAAFQAFIDGQSAQQLTAQR